MEDKTIEIWKPISFNSVWKNSDTSIFDDLAPSWYKKRKEFENGNSEYEEFLERLKRQHAIETGIVEKLYDLSEGITETLIKDGFVESYISHSDTNISPKKLMQHLHDHFEAMDFIFDLVKSERPLTIGFIKELHALVTKHQEYTDARDTLGNRVNILLLRGEFKKRENNPKREDGTSFIYCPPLQVDSEMDNLISIYEEQSADNTNPIILASWVHHALTQIHPFQDGNGRIARLLASLILIKNGLLPFTVKRGEKAKYIEALENADNGNPQPLVAYFSIEQKKSIENALNFKTEAKLESLTELASIFNEKINNKFKAEREKREQELKSNRDKIFGIVHKTLNQIKEELFSLIPYDKAKITIASELPDGDKYYWHTHAITDFANAHDYYFNRNYPRGWFGIRFNLHDNKMYDLIISVHHYGYEDNVMAIGSFLEFYEFIDEQMQNNTVIPLKVEPFTISLESINDKTGSNLDSYLHDVLKVGLTIIINEIN